MALYPIDKDVKAMLCKYQPSYFNGEGEDNGKQLKDWIKKMEDYFALAHSSKENKAMMGQFKLKKWLSYGGKIIVVKMTLIQTMVLGTISVPS